MDFSAFMLELPEIRSHSIRCDDENRKLRKERQTIALGQRLPRSMRCHSFTLGHKVACPESSIENTKLLLTCSYKPTYFGRIGIH